MAQADFDYSNTGQKGELSKTVSILADSDLSGAQWFEDAALAGLRIVHLGPLSDWADGDECPLGNVVLVECDRADAAALAALTRLDLLVERAGAELLEIGRASCRERVCQYV